MSCEWKTDSHNLAGSLHVVVFGCMVVGWFGTMLHLIGGAWSQVATPIPFCNQPPQTNASQNIDRVYMLTPTDVWLACCEVFFRLGVGLNAVEV